MLNIFTITLERLLYFLLPDFVVVLQAALFVLNLVNCQLKIFFSQLSMLVPMKTCTMHHFPLLIADFWKSFHFENFHCYTHFSSPWSCILKSFRHDLISLSCCIQHLSLQERLQISYNWGGCSLRWKLPLIIHTSDLKTWLPKTCWYI